MKKLRNWFLKKLIISFKGDKLVDHKPLLSPNFILWIFLRFCKVNKLKKINKGDLDKQ